MTPVEFLTARLDEREALAKTATPGPWTNVSRSGRGGVDVWTAVDSQRAGYEGMRDRIAGCAMTTGRFQGEVLNAAHIAANDPAYVLADIAAKRAIIDEYSAAVDQAERYRRYVADFDAVRDAQMVRDRLGLVLRYLIQPFADHPNFDPAWRL